jgi:hypothetical protein
VLIWVIGLSQDLLERIMQDKNRFDEQGERHGYWVGNKWIASYIHGKLFGYSEDFNNFGKVINREYYVP